MVKACYVLAAMSLFIVFEGGEGTGKTTQIKKIKSELEARDYPVTLSFEPGGTELGQKIRSLLLEVNTAQAPISARCEALMMAAARAQHVDELLAPRLKQGHVVLCDRYWDASRAYQGVARNLGLQVIDSINHFATQGLYPDRVYLFDLDGGKGLSRARQRAHEQSIQLDRMEQEGTEFHTQVREAYIYLAQSNPRFKIIDASKSIDEIFEILMADLNQLLKQKA